MSLAERFADELQLVVGTTTSFECRLYARWLLADPPPGWQIAGTLAGPSCVYAQTLAASYRFVARPGAECLLAEAVIPEPSFWTPHSPQLYQARLELRRGDDVLARVERLVGLRPLTVRGESLRLEGRRFVFRGAVVERAAPLDLAPWHDAEMAIVVDDPADDFCDRASRQGVLLAARLPLDGDLPGRLTRLSRFPAVGLVALAGSGEPNVDWRALAPNLLPARWLAADQPLIGSRWASVAFCEVASPESAARRLGDWPGPVIAVRRQPASDPLSARALCDRLQRDLAPKHDLAGYVV